MEIELQKLRERITIDEGARRAGLSASVAHPIMAATSTPRHELACLFESGPPRLVNNFVARL